MRAARRFLDDLHKGGQFAAVAKVKCELFGSLGATGRGHGTDRAVLLGLEGESPEEVDTDRISERVEKISASKILQLDGSLPVTVAMDRTLVFHRRKNLPGHPNGMRFTAETSSGDSIISRIYYSVGGGFVVDESAVDADRIVRDTTVLPHPFKSGTELLRMCSESGLSISALMLENEAVWREPQQVRQDLRSIWDTMHASIERGCEREGLLPGGLKVRRRAASLYRRLQATESRPDPMSYLDWVNLWAIAVNEENAAGGRVVTAPTNGAAGIIPAVLQYFLRFHDAATDRAVSRFLLTAGAIGIIYKTNASISGAEVGCQGEVGVACSMAAAGLAEVLGGTPTQVEDAAEIAMEHNLGLTCDPVGGLVQVPCIERNAMGAVKAINACRLALQGDGSGKVSLDKVIETMRQTGLDMKTKYKETARGGLAVNIIEC
jgi:L-serine dehydratase